MLTVFGSLNMDLIMQVAALPRPGETVLTEGYITKPGGKGANQAVAAARAGGRAGSQVAMAGAVGPDGYGQALRRNLEASGVDTASVCVAEKPTGIAYICVDAAAENFIAVASGANLSPRATDMPEEALAVGHTLLMQMEIPPEQNWQAIRRAGALGARTILNVAPAAAVPADVLEILDILIVNEHEARVVAASLAGSEQEPSRVARILADRFALTCIVTLGAQGVIFALGAGEPIMRLAALPIEPVDTTGAGDAFCGILAAGLDSGLDLTPALRRAVAGSALACLALGAQESLPSAAAIDEAVEKTAEPVPI